MKKKYESRIEKIVESLLNKDYKNKND